MGLKAYTIVKKNSNRIFSFENINFNLLTLRKNNNWPGIIGTLIEKAQNKRKDTQRGIHEINHSTAASLQINAFEIETRFKNKIPSCG